MKRLGAEVTVAAVAAQVFAAASPVLAAYRVPAAVVVLAAAAVGSTGSSYLCSRLLHLPAPLSYLGSAVALIAVLLGAGGPHPDDIARAAVEGPQRLLTETLPLAGSRALLAAPVILIWTAGAATVELLVRSGRPAGRTPGALVVPLVLFVALYAATSASPDPNPVGGPVLLAVTSLVAVLSTWSGRAEEPNGPRSVTTDSGGSRAKWRTAVTGVLAAGVVAAVLALASAHVPGLGQSGLSAYRSPPVVSPLFVDPLDSMAQLRDSGHSAVPELQVTTYAPSDGYLALADLDDYDGAQWSFSARFEPTGGRIPDASVPVDVNGTVSQDIVVSGSLPTPLLPALDRPLEVSGLAVSADRETGMFVPRSAGLADAYHVVSQTPSATLRQLPAADGISGLGSTTDLGLPGHTTGDLATAERYLAHLTSARPAPTVSFLQDVLTALAGQDRRVVTANKAAAQPSGGGGTSLAEVLNAVTVERAATPEQFATFVAVIARYLGIPARVVTGFRLAQTADGALLPAGTYAVSSAQAWAWVEVPVSGLGWLVVDPTPDLTTAAGSPPPEPAQATATTLPPRAPALVPRGAGTGGHALAPAVTPKLDSGAADDVRPILVGATVLGVALLLAAGPGQRALRRSLRRRRRRQGDPAAQVAGAWLELLDGVTRAGMFPSPGATAVELAAEIGHHFGAEPEVAASQLAAVADRALFCLRYPPSVETADAAWGLERTAVKSIAATLTRRQRIGTLMRR